MRNLVNEFNALVVRRNKENNFTLKVEKKSINSLAKKEILIKVYYSSLNYKDGMSCQGNPSITRKFPHTPGIDAVGVVEESLNPKFQSGDKVFIIGYPLGMNISGGFGEYIYSPADWVQKINFDLSFEEIMAYGTAGYTSALAVEKLINKYGEIKNKSFLVSGVSGGCGSFTAGILKKLGAKVTGISRKTSLLENFKNKLALDNLLDTNEFILDRKQNLSLPRWDGGFDFVGGKVLDSILKSIKINGDVTTAGIVESTQIETNLLPFILRGITLHGINTEENLKLKSRSLWNKLINEWRPKNFNDLYKVIELNDLPFYIDLFLQSKIIGRIVIKHNHKNVFNPR